MYQVIISRKLQGRGIFVTEDRNEPNMAPTPSPEGKIEERPVILGRKLAAKERRTLLKTRNQLKQHFGEIECHITPTAKEEKKIKGLCMQCPVCFTHGCLRSGEGNYAHPAIVLYDDAFSLGNSDIETLTLNAVNTKTYRTGTALGTETFVYGGTFINVVTILHDKPEILNLILDSIVSTHSYGARSRHYGRMLNEVLAILKGPRPSVTSYSLIGEGKSIEQIVDAIEKIAKNTGQEIIPMPQLKTPEEIFLAAHQIPEVQEWYEEVREYLKV